MQKSKNQKQIENVVIVSGSSNIAKKPLLKIIKKPNTLILAADNGFDTLKQLNIKPHLCVGDMDSVKSDLKNQKTLKFSTLKDKTDTQIAIEIAALKKPKHIFMFGCTGNRIDHTLSNINLLIKLLKLKIKAQIIDKNNIIQLCFPKTSITSKIGNICSLVPITTCKKVQTTGLKWNLKSETLFADSSRGISNIFTQKKATVKLKKGLLLLILTHD